MTKEVTLQIIELGNGRWRFDLKADMNDDEIWTLICRIKSIEKQLNGLLETDLIKATETIEYLRKKDRANS